MRATSARPRLAPSLLLAPCLCLGGCAWTTATVPVTMAPEINMQNYPSLGVWSLTGLGGEDITEEITQELVASGRFKVQNSRQLQELLRSQGQQVGAEFTGEMAEKLGRVMTTSAVISGRVRAYSYNENVTREQGTRPVYVDGKIKDVPATTHTRTGTASVGVSINVTDLATAQLLTTKVKESTAEESTQAVDQPPPPIDQKQLLAQARREVVREFMKAITPWQEKRQVTLYKTTGTFAFGGGEPEFGQGIELIQLPRPNWEKAGAAFMRGIERLEKTPGTDPGLLARGWYNYAVTLHYRAVEAKDIEQAEKGFTDALAAYDKALELRVDSDTAAARELCKEDQLNWKKLNPLAKNPSAPVTP